MPLLVSRMFLLTNLLTYCRILMQYINTVVEVVGKWYLPGTIFVWCGSHCWVSLLSPPCWDHIPLNWSVWTEKNGSSPWFVVSGIRGCWSIRSFSYCFFTAGREYQPKPILDSILLPTFTSTEGPKVASKVPQILHLRRAKISLFFLPAAPSLFVSKLWVSYPTNC